MTARANVDGEKKFYNEKTGKWELESRLKDMPSLKGLKENRMG